MRFLPYNRVAQLLGLLLIAAGAMKLYGLGFAPVSSLGVFSTPEFQFGLVELEVVVGLWLISQRNPIGSWAVALATFACFAAISFYLGSIGQASCGCLGRVTINPWYAFGVDVVAVVGLLFGRPDLGRFWKDPKLYLSRLSFLLVSATAGMAAILGLVLGVAILAFGSTNAALANLRGERLSIYPRLVNVGTGFLGQRAKAQVELVNRTGDQIRVVGGTSDSFCSVIGDLPVSLEPGESRTITFEVGFVGAPGIFTRKAALFTEDEKLRRVYVQVTGRNLTAEEKLSISANSFP